MGQRMQLSAPLNEEYVPGVQGVQLAAPLPAYCPALQSSQFPETQAEPGSQAEAPPASQSARTLAGASRTASDTRCSRTRSDIVLGKRGHLRRVGRLAVSPQMNMMLEVVS